MSRERVDLQREKQRSIEWHRDRRKPWYKAQGPMQKPKEKRKGEKDMEKLIEEEMGRGGEEKRKKRRLPSCLQLVWCRKAKLSVTDAGFDVDQVFYTRPFAQPPNSSDRFYSSFSRVRWRSRRLSCFSFRGGSRGLGRDEERRNDATERPAWKGTGRDETKGKRSPHLLRIATTRAR